MTVQKAIEIFNKCEVKRKVLGYWKDGDNIILRVKPKFGGAAWPEPGAYHISSDGKVTPTNPAIHEIISSKPMIRM